MFYYSEGYKKAEILHKQALRMERSLHTDRPMAGATWDKVYELKKKAEDLKYPINKAS